jgi:hypothetical protein
MRSKTIFRQASFYLAGLALLVSGATAGAEPAASRQALRRPLVTVSPSASLHAISAHAVDQWDSDVVKLKALRPGTLVLSGVDADAQAATSAADLFSFTLTNAAMVAIDATGPADLAVRLYAEDGTLLAADARGIHALDAGRYLVRITTAGAYELTVHADR